MSMSPSTTELPTLKHIRYNLNLTEKDLLRFSVMWQDDQFIRKSHEAYPKVHIPKDPKLFWVISAGYPDVCLLEGAESRVLMANKIFLHGCAATTKPKGSSHLNPDNSRVVFVKTNNPPLTMRLIRESLADWDLNWSWR